MRPYTPSDLRTFLIVAGFLPFLLVACGEDDDSPGPGPGVYTGDMPDGGEGEGEGEAEPTACDDPELNVCDAQADCTVVNDTVTCACKPGSFGDGLTCTDVTPDPFTLGTKYCSEPATAVRSQVVTLTGFDTGIQAGLSGDASGVLIINDAASGVEGLVQAGDTLAVEVTSGDTQDPQVATVTIGDVEVDFTVLANACDANATCSKGDNAIACTCNEGFGGNGFICDQI